MFQTVKLARLRLSDINVRTSADLSIDQLAADIEARGVLQNLLVTPVVKPRGHFAIFDGGRRFRALTLLAERGIIEASDHDVPVLVLKGDDQTLSETSLAANFQQLRLTPAEECRAFQHFLGEDGDIDAVARRFGITRRFVEGRLRLAGLAGPIFKALEAGEITLDIAKAYASTENVQKQLMIWEAYGGHGYVTADTVRRAIANETVKASDPVALLVGEDAYRAAGGVIDADLFSEGGDRWVNPEIAQRLATQIMEGEARRIAEDTGLGWVRPIASSQTYSASAGLHRVTLPLAPLAPDRAKRLETIEDRLTAISALMEDEALGEQSYEALSVEFGALEVEARELHASRTRLLSDDLKPQVGAFLTLSHRGELVLDCEYYSETPLGAGDQATAEPGPGHAGDTDVAAPRATAMPDGKPLSARLGEQLAVQRRDVLAANLLAHPALALDYALFVMIDARRRGGGYGSTIRARQPDDPVIGDPSGTTASAYLDEALDGLEQGWTEPDSAVERFDQFRLLDDGSKAAWFAYIVATSLEARPGFGAILPDPLQSRLAAVMAVDVALWWRPTSANFFDHVTKAAMLALLGEVGGPSFAARYAASKKSELSASCHALFAGEAIVEADVRERALAWIPGAMDFAQHGAAARASGGVEHDTENEEIAADDAEPPEPDASDRTGDDRLAA